MAHACGWSNYAWGADPWSKPASPRIWENSRSFPLLPFLSAPTARPGWACVLRANSPSSGGVLGVSTVTIPISRTMPRSSQPDSVLRTCRSPPGVRKALGEASGDKLSYETMVLLRVSLYADTHACDSWCTESSMSTSLGTTWLFIDISK